MWFLLFIILNGVDGDTLPTYTFDTLKIKAKQGCSFTGEVFSIEDIKRFPYFLEPDITRYIERLPGVISGSDFVYPSGLYIKGASPWESDFYFDGIPAIAPFHFISITGIPISSAERIIYFENFHSFSVYETPQSAFNIIPYFRDGKNEIYQSLLNTTVSLNTGHLNFTGRFFYPSLILDILKKNDYSLSTYDLLFAMKAKSMNVSGFFMREHIEKKDTSSDNLFSSGYSLGVRAGIGIFAFLYSEAKRYGMVEKDTLYNYFLKVFETQIKPTKNIAFRIRRYEDTKNSLNLARVWFGKEIEEMAFNTSFVVYYHKKHIFPFLSGEIYKKFTFKDRASARLSLSLRSEYKSGYDMMYEGPLIPSKPFAPDKIIRSDISLRKIMKKGTWEMNMYFSHHFNYRFYHVDRFIRLRSPFSFSEGNFTRERDSISLWSGAKDVAGISLKLTYLLSRYAGFEFLMGGNMVVVNAQGYRYYPSYNTPFKLNAGLFFKKHDFRASMDVSYNYGGWYATRVINYNFTPVIENRFYYYKLPSELWISLAFSRKFPVGKREVEAGISMNRLAIKKSFSFYLFPKLYNIPSLFVNMEF